MQIPFLIGLWKAAQNSKKSKNSHEGDTSDKYLSESSKDEFISHIIGTSTIR